MADLYLHLPFARRLRFADGLHPIPGEAVGRRPALVAFGAALASLPENERRGMSWFRRLFSSGGEAARWQKQLAPTPGRPHVEIVQSLLLAEDAALGGMARLAIAIGVLSHEILEDKIGPLTSSLTGPQRASVERAQARLWLQAVVPSQLDGEWRPALDSAEGDAGKRAILHVDRALKRVYGTGPGEAALARWVKALALELSPLVEARGPMSALPPSLSISDHDARGPHFEQTSFVEKSQAAVGAIVAVANRLGEAFTQGVPDRAAIADALGKLETATAAKPAEIDAQRTAWKLWVNTSKEAALARGRNPKPAFAEGEQPVSEQRLASITKVMTLADLPPEVAQGAAPPVPEQSGPMPSFRPGPPPPPALTQEVSLAQIEAEARAAGFQSPAHTQEVSMAQIEALESVGAAPDSTQEVATVQVISDTKITQPISQADIAEQNAVDAAVRPTAPPPPAMTDPPAAAAAAPDAAPVAAAEPNAPGAEPSATTATTATAAEPSPPSDGVGNGANGVSHLAPPAGVEPEPAATPAANAGAAKPAEEPPRE